MEYRRFKDTIVLRLNIGEDIVEKISELAVLEDIRLASVVGIGAVNDVTIGAFIPSEQKYYPHDYKGDFEVLGLNGNLTMMDNNHYTHLHITIGDHEGNAFGGHLNRAIVSATMEIFINIIDGELDRVNDPVTTLNILKF